MDKKALNKLVENLQEELKGIDAELSDIATENPMVHGDFDVKVEDLGSSTEDAAQEAGELDRLQALVDNLERRRKEIVNVMARIDKGNYGKCETCSIDISRARLKAMPVASLCIDCAQRIRI